MISARQVRIRTRRRSHQVLVRIRHPGPSGRGPYIRSGPGPLWHKVRMVLIFGADPVLPTAHQD